MALNPFDSLSVWLAYIATIFLDLQGRRMVSSRLNTIHGRQNKYYSLNTPPEYVRIFTCSRLLSGPSSTPFIYTSMVPKRKAPAREAAMATPTEPTETVGRPPARALAAAVAVVAPAVVVAPDELAAEVEGVAVGGKVGAEMPDGQCQWSP